MPSNFDKLYAANFNKPDAVFDEIVTPDSGQAKVRLPFEPTTAGASMPYFAAQDRLEETAQLVIGARHGSELVIATHRRDRPGLGLTIPTPVASAYIAIVQLRPGGRHDLFCDARHETQAELRTGLVSRLDLRHLWVADLQRPFHSFSFVIPQSLFDDLTDDLDQPRITSLFGGPSNHSEDQVMLDLAKAMYPSLKRPAEADPLFLSHIFEAASVHIAQTYGGLRAEKAQLGRGLARWQERRIKELINDDLSRTPTLEELSNECDLLPFRFSSAFKRSIGVPAHRWLLERRIHSAKNLLAFTGEDMEAVAKFCGFADAEHFARIFGKRVGVHPELWRTSRRN